MRRGITLASRARDCSRLDRLGQISRPRNSGFRVLSDLHLDQWPLALDRQGKAIRRAQGLASHHHSLGDEPHWAVKPWPPHFHGQAYGSTRWYPVADFQQQSFDADVFADGLQLPDYSLGFKIEGHWELQLESTVPARRRVGREEVVSRSHFCDGRPRSNGSNRSLKYMPGRTYTSGQLDVAKMAAFHRLSRDRA